MQIMPRLCRLCLDYTDYAHNNGSDVYLTRSSYQMYSIKTVVEKF